MPKWKKQRISLGGQLEKEKSNNQFETANLLFLSSWKPINHDTSNKTNHPKPKQSLEIRGSLLTFDREIISTHYCLVTLHDDACFLFQVIITRIITIIIYYYDCY